MTLSELKGLVANAEIMAKAKGVPEKDYPVYFIAKSGAIKDINSWSPADFNRGGVAFIER